MAVTVLQGLMFQSFPDIQKDRKWTPLLPLLKDVQLHINSRLEVKICRHVIQEDVPGNPWRSMLVQAFHLHAPSCQTSILQTAMPNQLTEQWQCPDCLISALSRLQNHSGWLLQKIIPFLSLKGSLMLAHFLQGLSDDLLDLKLVAADHFNGLLQL